MLAVSVHLSAERVDLGDGQTHGSCVFGFVGGEFYYLKYVFIIFMYVHVSLCLLYTSGNLRRPEEGVSSLDLELQAVVKCHICAGNNPGPLQAQQVLLAAEPSLQPQEQSFKGT